MSLFKVKAIFKQEETSKDVLLPKKTLGKSRSSYISLGHAS